MIIFAICGKSAAGKDTLTNRVSKKLKIPKVISCTTRPKRKNEIDGVDYKFINSQTMKELKNNNKLANYTSYKVVENQIWEYAYLKEDIEKYDKCLMILNPEGLRTIEEEYGSRKNVKIVKILIDAPLETRIIRSLDRNGKDTNSIVEIIRRAIADEKDFENIKPNHKIDTTKPTAYLKFVEIVRRELGNQLLNNFRRAFKNDPMRFLGGR